MDFEPELALWILEFVLRRHVRLETSKRLLEMIPSELEYPPRVQRAIVQRLLVEGLTRRFINTVTLDNIEALYALRPLPSAADAYCIVAVHLAASATDVPSAVADLWDRRVANILRSPFMAELASQRLISEGRNLCLAIAQPNLRARILARFTKNQALNAVRALLVADYEDAGPPIVELVAETIYRDEAENMASGSRAEATIPPVVAQQLQAMLRDALLQATPVVAQQQATRIMELFTENQVLDPVRALLEDDYEDVVPPILELVAETVDRDETENVPSGSRAEATIPPVVAQQLQATLRDALLQATPVVAQREMAQITPGAAQQQATPSAAQQQATPSAAQQQIVQITPRAAQQQATPIVAQQQATPRVAQQQAKDIPARVEQQQSTQMPSGAKATQMPPQGGESHMLPGGKVMSQQSEIDGGRLGKGTTTTMNEEGNSSKAMERGPAARTNERDGRLKGKAVCPPTLVENKRREVRRWSMLEEDTLRNAVRELGKGYWKEILRNHSDVFEGRTEVDLKDKWRNMTR